MIEHASPSLPRLARCAMLVAAMSFCTIAAHAEEAVSEDCKRNGVPLYGNVKIVDSFPDFRVQQVTSFPDLNVVFVTSFPDACGRWRLVESFPDFTVQYVDSFPDLKIRVVTSFPGLP